MNNQLPHGVLAYKGALYRLVIGAVIIPVDPQDREPILVPGTVILPSKNSEHIAKQIPVSMTSAALGEVEAKIQETIELMHNTLHPEGK